MSTAPPPNIEETLIPRRLQSRTAPEEDDGVGTTRGLQGRLIAIMPAIALVRQFGA